MAKSIKTNYIFNLIITVSSLLFPLITFPYASRVIQAENIGLVHFYQGILSYVSLFTCLGIPIYAIREIARVRDDEKKMNITSVEIISLHAILTVIGYLVICILGLTVDRIAENLPLYSLLSLSVILTTIGCEWFYQGIEDFKYIAIRGIIFKVLSVIALFALVHSKEDLMEYALATILGTVGSNIINFIRLRKYIKKSLFSIKELHPMRHLIPAIKVFALNLVISIYVNLDSVMLGFLSTNAAVGYYTAATKLTKLLLGIVASLQTTMIPRLSSLSQKASMDEFNALIQKVVDFVVTISLPLAVGLAAMAPVLIHLFCGNDYEPAVLTLQIISPIIFMISMSGIPCFQILYPLGHETIAILSTATGAVINFSLNWLLIPTLAENGAALATVIAETIVAITMFFYGRKYINVKKYDIHYVNCFIGTILMGFALWFLSSLTLSDWANLVVMPVVGASIYAAYLFVNKDSFGMYIIDFVKNKLHK